MKRNERTVPWHDVTSPIPSDLGGLETVGAEDISAFFLPSSPIPSDLGGLETNVLLIVLVLGKPSPIPSDLGGLETLDFGSLRNPEAVSFPHPLRFGRA